MNFKVFFFYLNLWQRNFENWTKNFEDSQSIIITMVFMQEKSNVSIGVHLSEFSFKPITCKSSLTVKHHRGFLPIFLIVFFNTKLIDHSEYLLIFPFLFVCFFELSYITIPLFLYQEPFFSNVKTLDCETINMH